MLERQAAAFPDEVFVSFEDGTSWTRTAALHTTYAAANALRKAGVRQGDRVGIMFPNGPEFLRAWWGSTALGAGIVPIHTAYRGHMLEHLLRLARPSVVVGDPELMRVFDAVPDRGLVPARRLTDADLHDSHCSDDAAPVLDQPIRSWNTQALLLTSGTTGPSKLADCSYRNILVGGCSMLCRRAAARTCCCWIFRCSMARRSAPHWPACPRACTWPSAPRHGFPPIGKCSGTPAPP